MVLGARDGRPEATTFVDDPVRGVRCHVQTEDHLPRCDAIFDAIDDAWTAQIDEWGWPEPLPDNGLGGTDGLDIYIHTDAAGGAYVTSGYIDADPDDGRMASSSYMVLAPSISVSEYPGYISHEFNHVLQFAVDMTEPAYPPWEGTATLAEERTYPGEGSGPTVVAYYRETPWAGPLRDGYWLENLGYWSWYEYGSVELMQWLEDEEGVSVPQLWLDMANPTWTNEPDFLDILTEDRWRDFNVWRADADGLLVHELDQELVVPRVQPWGVVFVDAPSENVHTDDEEFEVVPAGDRTVLIRWGPNGFDQDDDWTDRELVVTRVDAPQDSNADTADTNAPAKPPEDCGGCGTPLGGAGLLGLLILCQRRDTMSA